MPKELLEAKKLELIQEKVSLGDAVSTLHGLTFFERSAPRRRLRRHVSVKSRRNYETETLTTFGNVREASGDVVVVVVVEVVGEVQIMTADHLATPDLRHLDAEILQTEAPTVAHLRGREK